MSNFGQGGTAAGTAKPRDPSLPELITGLDEIQKTISHLGERVRIAADKLDGGKPRDAGQGGLEPQQSGAPMLHDLNRRALDMRHGLNYLAGELQRLETALGVA